MSDYMKDPVKPGETPQVGQKSSATTVVVVLLVIFVGLPLLFAIAALVFISANFDKFTAWIDSHIDDSYSEYVSVDAERTNSAIAIYTLANDARLRDAGLAKKDCENMKILAEAYDGEFIDDAACDAESIKINAVANSDSTASIMMTDGETCAKFEFDSNFTELVDYESDSAHWRCGEAVDIKLVDTGETPKPISGDIHRKKFSHDDDEEDELEEIIQRS